MLSLLESQIHVVLDDLSNEQSIEFTKEDIAEAVKQFEAALVKQTTPREPEFRLRMSNVGRLSCQLQMEQSGAPKERMPYNHWMRMVIGDCVEILTRMVLEKSKVEVSSDGDDVVLRVDKTNIKGSSDIDLKVDGVEKVFDIKSCSDWAYKNKWPAGFQGMFKDDAFGYVGQLYGYADAQDKEAGGWVVINKSSGEVSVVDVDATKDQEKYIRSNRRNVVDMIVNKHPFYRCMDLEEETFYKRLTGSKILNRTCTMCSFKKSCWPEAKFKKCENSKAAKPPMKWYVE